MRHLLLFWLKHFTSPPSTDATAAFSVPFGCSLWSSSLSTISVICYNYINYNNSGSGGLPLIGGSVIQSSAVMHFKWSIRLEKVSPFTRRSYLFHLKWVHCNDDPLRQTPEGRREHSGDFIFSKYISTPNYSLKTSVCSLALNNTLRWHGTVCKSFAHVIFVPV